MSPPFVAVLACGLLARLIVAWLPIETLVVYTLPDDAFIYFVIARNLGGGLGATFDGLRPTNGFHPLWALAIAPVFQATPDLDLAVHVALTLSALCDSAAGVLAAWTVARVTGESRVAPLLTLGLYLFHARAIQESVNGLETGLAVLALAGCVAAWVWVMEPGGGLWRATVFGALAGLCVLARSDLGAVVAALAAALAARHRWAHLLAAGICSALVYTPWLAWSQLRVGTMVQSSAVAIPSLSAYYIQSSDNFAQLWNSLIFPILNFSFRHALLYGGAALLAVLLAVVLLRWPGRARPVSSPRLLWAPLVGALAVVLIHTFVRWYPRGWYFAPLAWAGAIVAGPMLAAGLAAPAGRRYGAYLLMLLGLVMVGQCMRALSDPAYPAQADMQAGARWLRGHVDSTERVGAFNAGIYAYYGERPILNLDGLVDWGAIEARQQKRLLDYFVERGGTLIIDHRDYVEVSYSPFFGARSLEPVIMLPATVPAYGPIVLYRVK